MDPKTGPFGYSERGPVGPHIQSVEPSLTVAKWTRFWVRPHISTLFLYKAQRQNKREGINIEKKKI